MQERLISRKDLCNQIGMRESSLRTYITRGRIIEAEQGFINLDDSLNKDYLIKWALNQQKNIDFLFEVKPELKQEPTKKEIIQEPEPKITPREKAEERKYRKALHQKSIYETELKRLELEKKKGNVIPIEFAIEMIQRYINGTFGDIVNSGNKLIDEICNELDADIEVKLKYKKMLNAIITETIQNKHKPVSEEIIQFAKEYSLMNKW